VTRGGDGSGRHAGARRGPGGCVAAGIVTSTDVGADAVALWLGLHGPAHQQSVTVSFPWPPDIAERLVGALAHLTTT